MNSTRAIEIQCLSASALRTLVIQISNSIEAVVHVSEAFGKRGEIWVLQVLVVHAYWDGKSQSRILNGLEARFALSASSQKQVVCLQIDWENVA